MATIHSILQHSDWWPGLAVMRWSCSTQLLYVGPG